MERKAQTNYLSMSMQRTIKNFSAFGQNTKFTAFGVNMLSNFDPIKRKKRIVIKKPDVNPQLQIVGLGLGLG